MRPSRLVNIALTESKFLVILGIGNAVRMDDGAGIKTVEMLECDPELEPFKITFSYLNMGGFDILDEIDGFNYAIIVDAADIPGLQPGEIYHLPNFQDYKNKQINEISGFSSHGTGVLHVLKYANMGGYQIPQNIEIYGIQVKETEYFSEQLTPEVANGVETLLKQLKTRINYIFADYP